MLNLCCIVNYYQHNYDKNETEKLAMQFCDTPELFCYQKRLEIFFIITVYEEWKKD